MLNENSNIRKNNLTLIIDGNWLWMSRLTVLNKKYNNVIDLCKDLKLMVAKSINIVIRQFPEIDNIIFVTDGGSWRTQIPIPECIKNKGEGDNRIIIEYKGTRVTNDLIDWDVVWSNYTEFTNILNECGITTCREKDIEGDDWIYHWTTYLNSKGINTMIWSKDNDLKQLVKIDSNKCFTVWWNKDAGIYSADFPDTNDTLDFFFNYEYNKNEEILNGIINHSKMNINKINPYNIIIDKILKGDSSDNILPIAIRKSKSNTDKKFKISSRDINYDIDINNKEDIKNYFDDLLSKKTYVGRVEDSITDILEHFEYNKQLVVLDKKSYPQEVLDIFDKYTDYTISTNISEVETKLRAESNKLNGILDII